MGDRALGPFPERFSRDAALLWLADVAADRIKGAVQRRFDAYLVGVAHLRDRESLADRRDEELIGAGGLMHQVMRGCAYAYVVAGPSEAADVLRLAVAAVERGR